jgi:ketosteroid isomerase-like protein
MGVALDVVGAGWNAYFAGDVEGVIALMAEDVEIDLTNYEGWPEDAVYYGHAGFRRFMEGWLASWERYEAGLHEIEEMSPVCVFTVSWQRGYGAGSRVPVEMTLAEIATVKDGLLARFELWSDRHAARVEAVRR